MASEIKKVPNVNPFQNLIVIWAILFGANVVLVIVAYSILKNSSPLEDSNLSMWLQALAILVFLLAWLLPRFIQRSIPIAIRGGSIEANLSSEDRDVIMGWNPYMARIITFDIVSFLGVMASRAEGNIIYSAVFSVLAMVGLGFNFPTRVRLKSIGKKNK